jgi:ferredoxin
MMKAVVGGLQGAGVAQDQIKTESFGPAGSPFRSEDLSVPALTPASTAPATDWQITFRKSGKTVAWDPKARSLWHFAEKNGIEISSGCLYGDCGTCLTRLVEGRVTYLHKTGAQPDAGSCLPCSCKPNGPITIEA